MGTMTDWATGEVMLACHKENPNWKPGEFDYGCSCYESALKAFKVLMNDGHSGGSFSITRNILNKLMNNIPLSPITDDDFFRRIDKDGNIIDLSDDKDYPKANDEWLKDAKLKSDIQCPRRSSLFREETLDGVVRYHDNDRAYCIDVECPSDTFGCGLARKIDELFPITMPYFPSDKQYKCYVQTFVCDKSFKDYDPHKEYDTVGIYDTQALLYIVTPEGEKIDIGYYQTEIDGKMTEITKEEYEDLLNNHRLDPVYKKAATSIWHDILDPCVCSGDLYKICKEWYKSVDDEVKNKWESDIRGYCKFFETHCDVNTWNTHRALVERNEYYNELIKEYPVLNLLGDYIQGIVKERDRYIEEHNK